MKFLTTFSTSCLLAFATAGAARAEAVVRPGDSCDVTERLVTIPEAKENLQGLCKLVEEKRTVRLAGRGMLRRWGDTCLVKENAPSSFDDAFCMKAPRLSAAVGTYDWQMVKSSSRFGLDIARAVMTLHANGTCKRSQMLNWSLLLAGPPHCTWVVSDHTHRKITLNWVTDLGWHGREETVSLSADGMTLEGRSVDYYRSGTDRRVSGDRQVSAVRIVEDPSGEEQFLWYRGDKPSGITTITSDGTCSNTERVGVKCKWVRDWEQQTVTMTWGEEVDNDQEILTLNREYKSLSGSHSRTGTSVGGKLLQLPR